MEKAWLQRGTLHSQYQYWWNPRDCELVNRNNIMNMLLMYHKKYWELLFKWCYRVNIRSVMLISQWGCKLSLIKLWRKIFSLIFCLSKPGYHRRTNKQIKIFLAGFFPKRAQFNAKHDIQQQDCVQYNILHIII